MTRTCKCLNFRVTRHSSIAHHSPPARGLVSAHLLASFHPRVGILLPLVTDQPISRKNKDVGRTGGGEFSRAHARHPQVDHRVTKIWPGLSTNQLRTDPTPRKFIRSTGRGNKSCSKVSCSRTQPPGEESNPQRHDVCCKKKCQVQVH